MTGPNSALGEGNGDSGGDSGAAANNNPFTKKSKTENEVRVPTCPDVEKKHPKEKVELVNGGGENHLLVCPKCQKVYHIDANRFAVVEPEWEEKNK